MLTQELDHETERYLADILAQQNITSDALIRELIRDRWLSLRHHNLTESQLELGSSTTAQIHRPRNQKQTIADFVRRKNLGTQVR
ncbi:MAG: hypothetical protein HC827_00880 [Cyanobacteria bacterium RM1_2_2]|nr:hypothetical protein [Cyanobacteria bacterium RM1_2_2]